MTTLTQHPEWTDLIEHKETLPPLKDLHNSHTISDQGILLDYSKNAVTKETIDKLINLAKACDLESWRTKMFSGEKINNTENRAVLHTALRAPKDAHFTVDGENVMPFVHDTLQRMKDLSEKIREEGQITDVVNIGVGGSDLGAHMVCKALKHLADGPKAHFVSNIDGAHINQKLETLNPKTTLFLIASKSFTTQETISNAHAARKWFLESCSEDEIKNHFIALSCNTKEVMEFGISEENMLPFKDWVGGRHSLWSPIGLIICIHLGFHRFQELLNGAHAMDQHFQETPLDKNIPVILALIGVWHRNFWNAESMAILPYAQNLNRFPAFLQQLDMESNGKSVTHDGSKLDYNTGPIVFGQAGVNGQHAFYQLIHQGTSLIPSDFILFKEPYNGCKNAHHKLLANGLAQADALMNGQTLEEANNDPHRVFEGNIPSNTLVFDALTPFTLGQLIAIYEHKIFVQGVIWDLNSYDQPGVELGKTLANDILDNGAKTDLHKYVLSKI